MRDDKRKYRQLKRNIKRAGSKHRRRDFKRQIRENPQEAHEAEENFGRYSSAPMNAHDQDATRKQPGDEEE
jgi:hypothetical protein